MAVQDALFSHHVLSTLNSSFSDLGKPLPFNIPSSVFGIIHGLRVAHAYRSALGDKGARNVSPGQVAAIPIVLVFGGGILSSIILGLTPPGALLTPWPMLNYALASLVLFHTPLYTVLNYIPTPILSIIFLLIDAFGRTVGITAISIDPILSHPLPQVRSSPFLMLLICTLTGGGGAILVPFIDGFSPQWKFGVPGWLKDEGIGVDIWSCTVVGLVYAVLVDAAPEFRIMRPAFVQLFGLVGLLPEGEKNSVAEGPFLTKEEARAFCSIVLLVILGIHRSLPVLKGWARGVEKKAEKGAEKVKGAKVGSEKGRTVKDQSPTPTLDDEISPGRTLRNRKKK